VDSWDSAIKRARLKIAELQVAIQVFQNEKESGSPWGTQQPKRKAS